MMNKQMLKQGFKGVKDDLKAKYAEAQEKQANANQAKPNANQAKPNANPAKPTTPPRRGSSPGPQPGGSAPSHIKSSAESTGFVNSSRCTYEGCGASVGMLSTKYYCARCRHTFCEKHGKKKHQPPPFAEDDEQEVRVCDDCCKIWQKEAQVARVARRKERVHDYLNKRLEPYVQDQTDTTKAKMTRVAHGAYKVSKVLPIPSYIKSVLKGMELYRKYGVAALGGLMMSDEIFESVQILQELADEVGTLNKTQTTLAFYYLMAYRRGQRGDNPMLEEEEHSRQAGCEPISDKMLAEVIWYAAYSCVFAYEVPVVEVQRLVAIHGFTLVFAISDSDYHKPVFQVVAREDMRLAMLILRGTQNLADCLTDVTAKPKELEEHELCPGLPPPPGDKKYLVHEGMMNSARWVCAEVLEPLQKLVDAGYRVVVLGHSLGAAVAAGCTILLRRTLPKVSSCAALGSGEQISADQAELKKRLKTCWAPQYRDHGAAKSASERSKARETEAQAFIAKHPSYKGHNLHMFCPGKVIHIYHVQGQSRTTVVACFTRQARSKPPTWQPYCTADGCHLCKSSFVWNSTFKSEAQECRDKHNCRACGKVVCKECSTRKKPLPEYGILKPQRVCDYCFFTEPNPFL